MITSSPLVIRVEFKPDGSPIIRSFSTVRGETLRLTFLTLVTPSIFKSQTGEARTILKFEFEVDVVPS